MSSFQLPFWNEKCGNLSWRGCTKHNGPAFDRALWAPELLIRYLCSASHPKCKVPLGARSERDVKKGKDCCVSHTYWMNLRLCYPYEFSAASFSPTLVCKCILMPWSAFVGSLVPPKHVLVREWFYSQSPKHLKLQRLNSGPGDLLAALSCTVNLQSILPLNPAPHPLLSATTCYYLVLLSISLHYHQRWAHPAPQIRSTGAFPPLHRDPPIGSRVPPLGGSRRTDLKGDIVTVADTKELCSMRALRSPVRFRARGRAPAMRYRYLHEITFLPSLVALEKWALRRVGADDDWQKGS